MPVFVSSIKTCAMSVRVSLELPLTKFMTTYLTIKTMGGDSAIVKGVKREVEGFICQRPE